MVIEATRAGVSRKYPSLMPTLFPGALMTEAEPYPKVQTMR